MTEILLNTNETSSIDIDRDPFGNKLNHNYSVINEMSMNDIDRNLFGNKLNNKSPSDSLIWTQSSLIATLLELSVLYKTKLIWTLFDKSNRHKSP